MLQGALDFEQCSLVWGGEEWSDVLAEWFGRHGVPADVTDELIGQGALYKPFIRFQPDPVPLEAGDDVDGWRIVAAPGHADGQLMLLRDGVLAAGDHLLDPITPTVGLWPESRPDPLGDYLGALEATIALEPTLALPGHGEPIDDPVGRAHELIEHHRERLARTAAALGRAVHRLRGLVRALRRRPEACGPAVRRRRDALPPRAPRPRGRRGPPRARRRRVLYFRLSGRRATAQYPRPGKRGDTFRRGAR